MKNVDLAYTKTDGEANDLKDLEYKMIDKL
jgi:hypothetical protein